MKKLNEFELKDLSSIRISNGAFNDPRKTGKGYKLINVKDLYNEFRIDESKLKLLNISEKEYKRYAVKNEDIFFTRSSLKAEGIAHCNIFDNKSQEVIYECHIMRVRPDINIVDPFYLFYFCKSFNARKYFIRHSKIATMTTIDQTDLGALPVTLPPLPEQKAIADLLSTWDKPVEKTEQLIQAKEKRFKGYVQRLIDQRCAEWTHIKPKKIFDTITEKNFPDEELLSVTQDRGVIPRSMLEGRVMSPNGTTASYKLIKSGDFAISLRSFQGGIEYSNYQGIISPAYTVLRPKIDINTEFYRHFFKTYIFIEKYLNLAVIGIRDGKQISIPDFMSIKIPVPPLEEQKQIAETLSTAQQEIDLLKHLAEKYKNQKRGLMQKLLTGDWRIKPEILNKYKEA